MLVHVGQHISAGQPLLNIFAPTGARLDNARQLVSRAIAISPTAPTATPLIVPLDSNAN
jgi:thymidine phosphorylase